MKQAGQSKEESNKKVAQIVGHLEMPKDYM
jgi:hypothetical protein